MDDASGLKQWVQYFDSVKRLSANKTIETRNDLGCYLPINFQSRFLVRMINERLATLAEPPFEAVNASLHKVMFLGITEQFHESLCLFYYQVSGEQRKECQRGVACSDKPPPATTLHEHVNHGVPHLDRAFVDIETLSTIETLTAIDIKMYAEALRLFQLRLAIAGKETGWPFGDQSDCSHKLLDSKTTTSIQQGPKGDLARISDKGEIAWKRT
jgi:hypothetical protein